MVVPQDGEELEMTEEQKAQIDAMSQVELCRLWRHAESGHPLLQGDAGAYFKQRLDAAGGFTPAISKLVGW